VEAPKVHPGVACAQGEEGLHDAWREEEEEDDEDGEGAVGRGVVEGPGLEEMHGGIAGGAEQEGGDGGAETVVAGDEDGVDEDHDGQVGAAQVEHEGEQAAEDLLVSGEAQKAAVEGEIHEDADGEDDEDDNGVAGEVGGVEVELLVGVAAAAEDEVGDKGEEDAVPGGPGEDFSGGLDAGGADEGAVEVHGDAGAEEVQAEDAAEDEDDGSVEPEAQGFAESGRAFGSSGGEVWNGSVAGDEGDEADLDDHKNQGYGAGDDERRGGLGMGADVQRGCDAAEGQGGEADGDPEGEGDECGGVAEEAGCGGQLRHGLSPVRRDRRDICHVRCLIDGTVIDLRRGGGWVV
jgi:hypothetical protein